MICSDYINIDHIYKHLDRWEDLRLVLVPMFSPKIQEDFYPKADALARRHIFTVLCNAVGTGACGGSGFFGSVSDIYKPPQWREGCHIFGPPLDKNDHEGILLAHFELGHPEAETIRPRGRQEFVNFKDRVGSNWIKASVLNFGGDGGWEGNCIVVRIGVAVGVAADVVSVSRNSLQITPAKLPVELRLHAPFQ